MKRKHITAVLLSALLVASSAVSVFAAPYDFTRISDKKVFPLIDVATTPEYLADIATDMADYTIELKGGKKYPLVDYAKVKKDNPTFTEDQIIEELNKMAGTIVSVSAITNVVAQAAGQQLEIGVNDAKDKKTVDELKAMGYEVKFEFTVDVDPDALERKTGLVNMTVAPFNVNEFEYKVILSKDGKDLASAWKKVHRVADLTAVKEVTEAKMELQAPLSGTASYLKPGDTIKFVPSKGVDFNGDPASETALQAITTGSFVSDNLGVLFPTAPNSLLARAGKEGVANVAVTFTDSGVKKGTVKLSVIVKKKDDALAKVEPLNPDAKYGKGAKQIATVLKDANGIVLRDPIKTSDVKVSLDGVAIKESALDVSIAGKMIINVDFQETGKKTITVMDKEGKVELGKFDVMVEDITDSDNPDDYKLKVSGAIKALDIKTDTDEIVFEVQEATKNGVVVAKANYHNNLKVFVDGIEVGAQGSLFIAGADVITDLSTDAKFGLKLIHNGPYPAVGLHSLELKLVEGDRTTVLTKTPFNFTVNNSTPMVLDIEIVKPLLVERAVDLIDAANSGAAFVAAVTAGRIKATVTNGGSFDVSMIEELKYYKDTKTLDIKIKPKNGGINRGLRMEDGEHAVLQKIKDNELTPTLGTAPADNGNVEDMTLAGSAAGNVDMTFTVSGASGGTHGDNKWDTGEKPSYVMTLKAKDTFTFEDIGTVAHAVQGATGATQVLSSDKKTLTITFVFDAI
ncbi:MAG: hypothetical protein Q4A78_09055 [Peptostreptococcaceae bacterium]|nr:hypothetical protein [Peptostreptococcaceae bacterium]